jgi:hypothetical protein
MWLSSVHVHWSSLSLPLCPQNLFGFMCKQFQLMYVICMYCGISKLRALWRASLALCKAVVLFGRIKTYLNCREKHVRTSEPPAVSFVERISSFRSVHYRRFHCMCVCMYIRCVYIQCDYSHTAMQSCLWYFSSYEYVYICAVQMYVHTYVCLIHTYVCAYTCSVKLYCTYVCMYVPQLYY